MLISQPESRLINSLVNNYLCRTNIMYLCRTNITYLCRTNITYLCCTNITYLYRTNITYLCYTNITYLCHTNITGAGRGGRQFFGLCKYLFHRYISVGIVFGLCKYLCDRIITPRRLLLVFVSMCFHQSLPMVGLSSENWYCS